LEEMAEADEARICESYQLLFSRLPSDSEVQIGLNFLTASASRNEQNARAAGDRLTPSAHEEPTTQEITRWQQYAQTLLSSNEFMFVR
jgi:hypothetical protein